MACLYLLCLEVAAARLAQQTTSEALLVRSEIVSRHPRTTKLQAEECFQRIDAQPNAKIERGQLSPVYGTNGDERQDIRSANTSCFAESRASVLDTDQVQSYAFL